MGFFDNFKLDDISRKLTELSQGAINQGSQFAENAMTRVRMSDCEKQLNNAYAELGRKLFDSVKDNPSDDLAPIVTKINDLHVQIQQYMSETRYDRGMVACPNCGAESPAGTVYCSKCGSAIPQPGVVSNVVCPNCNASLPEGTQFCTSCGANVQSVAPQPTQIPLGQVDLSSGVIPQQSPAPQYPFVQQTPPQESFSAPDARQNNTPEQMSVRQSNLLTLEKEPAAPVYDNKTVYADNTPPSMFPQGSSNTLTPEMDTNTVYGDTNAPSGGFVNLDKN